METYEKYVPHQMNAKRQSCYIDQHNRGTDATATPCILAHNSACGEFRPECPARANALVGDICVVGAVLTTGVLPRSTAGPVRISSA